MSGHPAVRPRASQLPLALATIGVLALVAGGFWWIQRNTSRPPVRADSGSVVRPGTDTGDVTATLPSRPMTHEDSLQLLAALQSQLKQVDPRYRQKAVTKAVVSDSLALEVQTRQIDSMIRAQFREFALQRSGAGRGPGNPTAAPSAPTAPVVPGATSLPKISSTLTAAPRRLLILMPMERTADSTLQSLQHAAAADLAARTNRFSQWASVMIDSTGRTNVRDVITSGSADVLAYISLHHEITDSVHLQVSIRNAAPGTSFGYRVITSDAVYRPTSIEPFSGTLREASRLLGQLRQLPPGQPWSQDMGRAFVIPNLQGPSVRTFTPKSLDSLRTWAESLRVHRPRTRDSLIDH